MGRINVVSTLALLLLLSAPTCLLRSAAAARVARSAMAAPSAATPPSAGTKATTAREPWDNDVDPFAEPKSEPATGQAGQAGQTLPATTGTSRGALAKGPATSGPSGDSVRLSLRTLFTVGGLLATHSDWNPNNVIYAIPRQFGKLEARPDLAFASGLWSFNVRPRFEVEYSRVRPGQDDTRARGYLLEWFGRFQVTPALYASVGSEYLQWGPSQLISPSNVFFPENPRQNPVAQIPGSHFARAVWVMSPKWTLSAVVNFEKGPEQFSIAPFERRYALKADYGSNSWQLTGLVAYGERSTVSAGGYALWTPHEAVLLYTDFRVDARNRVLYPHRSDGPFGLSMDVRSGAEPAASVLTGASYTFANNVTAAAEYLYQSSGYSQSEVRDLGVLRSRLAEGLLGTDALGASAAADMMNGAVYPGLRFLRRHYVVSQVRYQWGDGDGLASLWWISNIEDRSQSVIANVEAAVSDHVQLVGFGMLNFGPERPERSEFPSILRAQGLVGASYTF